MERSGCIIIVPVPDLMHISILYMIAEFLHRPYPFPSTRGRFLTPLAFAVFISLFLFVFQPFGLSRLDKPMAWIAAGYGLMTFLVVFVEMWALPLLFPAYFKESSWTVGREIAVVVLDVFLIGLCNLLYSAWVLELPLSFRAAIWYQAVTVIIAILPLTIWVLYKQLKLQKRYMAEAKLIDTHVQERREPEKIALEGTAMGKTIDKMGVMREEGVMVNDKRPPMVTIPAEQAGEPLQLAPNQLLYIAAADNYIKVHHLEQGMVKQTLLRSSLKKVADGLADHPQFFRCHRTFLVNLGHVTEVSGNAQGYKLQLAYTGDWIPVSRSLHEEIRQKL